MISKTGRIFDFNALFAKIGRMLTLEAKLRDAEETRDTLKKNGLIPAVFYGRKEKSTSIAVNTVNFKKVFATAGESSIINLKTDKGELSAIIQDVEFDPVKDEPRHVDFYVVEQDKILEVEVPLVFTGISPAVRDLGGVLVKVLHVLPIEALPKDLPHEVEVDISILIEIGGQITAQDLKLPSGVELKTKAEEVVALVSEAMKEEEIEKPPEVIDMSAIEVEKRGKEEEVVTEAAPADEKKEAQK